MAFFLILTGIALAGGGAIYLVFEERAKNSISNIFDVLKQNSAPIKMASINTKMASVNTMLQKWNEQEISLELKRLQDQPNVFRHFVDSVKQRFIDNQNVKTAESRIGFLEKQVKILRLASEYSDVQNDLSLKHKKYENESLRLDAENQSLRLGFKDEATEKELQRLDYEHRKIESELKIAETRKRLDELKNPPQSPKQPTREEIRAQKLAETEAHIEKLEREIAQLKEKKSMPEDARQAHINQINNKLFELYQKRLDLL